MFLCVYCHQPVWNFHSHDFFLVNLTALSRLLFLIGFFNFLGINIVFKLDIHIFVIHRVVASNLKTLKVTEDMSNRNMFDSLEGT